MERLRSQMEAMGRKPGQRGQIGQQGQQAGQRGQQGQQGQGQQGQGQKGQGQQGGQGQGQQAGRQGQGQMGKGGPWGGEREGRQGGEGGERNDSAMNRGDYVPELGAVPSSGSAAGAERMYCEGLRDLSQLRQSMQESPEMARDVQELIREMQRLDPSRFQGNPELVEQLRSQVLTGLEQLELQLRRQLEDSQSGQVRSGMSRPVPNGYQQPVAEYFRRLSQGKK
ncbi:MAG: hypothetical protein JJE04_24620 [Acidobacteriia bacterium]|nr:hypothetical protein [Terriglobia bacterium]